MARPKLAVPVRRYYINLTLREGEDDDLIAFLEHVPVRQRVRAIKSALRAGQHPADEPNEPNARHKAPDSTSAH